MSTNISTAENGVTVLKAKDFASEQEVRWCPGCGDYSILKQVQSVMAELSLNKDEVAIISGIGCSSRFPYYMDTYGMHSIHGRATAIASGLKMANPALDIWIITGDGDGLSIGGNHMLHILRRNFNLNILLFNNQIYGLTKGQYSPTSEEHKITKSTPIGSIDHPVNPLAFALGADASFVARSIDRDPKHLKEVLLKSHGHRGTSFVEIYQNCPIFNDGAFFAFSEKETRPETALFLEQGKPLVFGHHNEKGVRLDQYKPQVVDLEKDGFSPDDLWVHDETDLFKAQILARMMGEWPGETIAMPRPFGVLYAKERPCYETLMTEQIETAIQVKGEGDLQQLLTSNHTWEIR